MISRYQDIKLDIENVENLGFFSVLSVSLSGRKDSCNGRKPPAAMLHFSQICRLFPQIQNLKPC